MFRKILDQHKNITQNLLVDKNKPRRTKSEKSILASNLNRIMRERNLNIRTMAQMATISTSTMADWLAGASPSDLQKVHKLAQALNVSFSYLCLGIVENQQLNNIPLEALFSEESTGIEGIYKLSAVRLVRKK